MRVEALLFGRPRELAGCAREEVSLAPDASLADLFESLGGRHGPLLASELGRKEGLIILVNGRDYGLLGGMSAPLKADDTVAVFPIAGGG
jgi:molybdopterin converting factor small subunit